MKHVMTVPKAYRQSGTQPSMAKNHDRFYKDGYRFPDGAVIARTDLPISDALKQMQGKCFSIFRLMEAGKTVGQLCMESKKYEGTRQYDIFHALVPWV